MAVGDNSLELSHRMEDSGRTIKVSILWKGNKYTLEINSESSLKDLGYELRKLTGVTADTLRLIVPRLNEKGSTLILPFFDKHSSLSLQESNIIEILLDMRILGFEEEERRLRQKKSYGSGASIKLPQGSDIFCDFRTLQIPGIELNPPPSAALRECICLQQTLVLSLL